MSLVVTLTNKNSTIYRNNKGDARTISAGFILPYVMVTIAILAFAGTIAVNRIQNTTKIVARLQEEATAQLALQSAETQTLYTLLTSTPISFGLDVKNTNPGPEASLQDIRNADAPELWAANGELRLAATPHGDVLVSYRDVGGLVPLNTADKKVIVRFLKSLGIGADKARKMAASLADYVDSDHARQFGGAERAEYRLHRLAPPTNSPLRKYSELYRVMHWPEQLLKMDMERFKDQTTLASTSFMIQKHFADPQLYKTIGSAVGDIIDPAANATEGSILSDNTYPSRRSRITLRYQSPQGRVYRRVIEVKRDIGGHEYPFRRFLIYDVTVLHGQASADFKRINRIKNVVYTTSHQPR
jgi:type II secretory pathway pseudopilin PulG